MLIGKKFWSYHQSLTNILILYKQYTEMKVFCFDIVSVSLETISFIFSFSCFEFSFLMKEGIVLGVSF